MKLVASCAYLSWHLHEALPQKLLRAKVGLVQPQARAS